MSLTAVGAERDAALLRELAVNNPRKAQGEEQLKVWPTNINRAAFQAVMAPDGPPVGHVNDPGNLIDETFEYFSARTQDYLASTDEAETQDAVELSSERAERLRITLCDLLKVVSITLDVDDNAQVIFETLNARGTPLLALDLVKNSVFHLASRQGRDSDRDADCLYKEVWRPQLDDDYWRQERRQATDAEALIEELCADAAVMRSFDVPEPKSREAEFFKRMEALDAGTVLPIVLLLFRSKEITGERRRRGLRILESWLARRALMRLTSKNHNRLAPRLIGRMKADLEHADDVLLDALSGGEGEISRWPDDDEFTAFLRTENLYGTVGQARLVMALGAVETYLYSNKTDIPELSASLSLEHLMPQTWETYWPLADANGDELTGETLEEATTERWMHISRLGNLTLVTGPLNAGLSNGSWSSKRRALNAESKLLLNARLVDQEVWDESAIDARGAWLAEALAKIWPGPGAENWAG